MEIVEPKEKLGFPKLELGDVVIYNGEFYILMHHSSGGFMFTSTNLGGFNGRHDTIQAITERTKDSPAIKNGEAKLYRSSEYEMHLIVKQ